MCVTEKILKSDMHKNGKRGRGRGRGRGQGRVKFRWRLNNLPAWSRYSCCTLKQKLELGIVLQVEIVDIRVVAPLFLDLFVLISNLRFKSQSDVILAGSL